MRSLVCLIIVLSLSKLAQAQEYDFAIGARGGNGASLSVQYFFNYEIAIEGLVGIYSFANESDLYTSARFKYHYSISSVERLYFFYGVGVSYVFTEPAGTGILATIGFDYSFQEMPLNFGIDFSPGYIFGNDQDFELNPGVSIRYYFDR